jgi:choline dehydrogenase-like flavoprotein
MTDIAVIGAGPAGVSVALSLRDRGLRPLLIDRADEVASAWRSRYDRLKLNTSRPFSHLPNRPYPKGTAMFPTRDDVVAHLDRHARESESSCGWVPKSPASSGSAPVGDWKPRPPGSMPARSSSPLETSTPRAFPSGRVQTASPPNCCTRRHTETRLRMGAGTCWWSARVRRGWRSHTTLQPVVPARCG